VEEQFRPLRDLANGSCTQGPRDRTYIMLSGCYLGRFKLARVSAIPLDMGNTCPLQSFSSNSTFIMLYFYHGMVTDYLVVNQMITIKIV
jgi:hypothetical protein